MVCGGRYGGIYACVRGMVVGIGVCVHVYTTHFLACQDLMVAHFTSKSGFCFSATPTRSEGPSWSWPRIREEVTHNIAPTVSE